MDKRGEPERLLVLNSNYSLITVLWYTYVTEIQSILFNCCDVSAPKPSEQSVLCIAIGELIIWNFWHSMATNWSIMAARAQMEQVQLEEFNLKGMKSMEDQSTTYELIQSFIKQLTLVVKQCSFHAFGKSDHLQLRPEAAIILQFLRCLGYVTS